MAERRMFSKTIIDSDNFLDMPMSAQLLYFHLAMRADDEGFINSPKKIQRIIGASDDDARLLIAKSYIIPFDSGIVVVKHWRIHNLIRKDRFTPTKCIDERAELRLDANNSYTIGEGLPLDGTKKERKPLTEAQQKRLEARKESDLPSSFDNKIRNAFVGKICPVCNCLMNYENNLTSPTIQHNVPISLGGKHEIDNISVICRRCNSSIQNKVETPPYNTDLVRLLWESIGNEARMKQECSGNVTPGKDRLGKDRLGKDSSSSNARAREEKQPLLPPLNSAYIKKYIDSIRPTASKFEIDQLTSYEEDGISGEVIELAIEEALLNNKPNLKYIKAILDRCLDKGIKTADKFKAQQNLYKNSNKSNEIKQGKEKENDFFKKFCNPI